MHKVVITYLAILILFQGMFSYVNIIFEIGEVIEDYQLHKTKYGDSLTVFLSKHYGDLRHDHKEQHKEEHKQHNHPIQSDLGSNTHEVYVLQTINFTIENIVEISNTSNNFSYNDLFSTFEKQKIFQPPQLS